ncbi:hypothetical protein SAMN05216180_2422, partial [Hydrogenoanaerobacterium saccharovorans]
FAHCKNLTTLPTNFRMPNHVENMSYAFQGCKSLKTLPNDFTIPNSVINMSNAFYGCDQLELPSSFKIPTILFQSGKQIFGPKKIDTGVQAQFVTYHNNNMKAYAMAHPDETNWIEGEIQTEYDAGQFYNFTVSANNVTNFKDIVYVLNYDNKYFDIVNLFNGVNPTKTTIGEVPGTEITILEITPTKIKFKCNKEVPAGKSWSGVVNIITLKAKQNTLSNVSVSTETK